MGEVLITGSSGIIGSVIQEDCVYPVKPFDLPEHDATNYDDVLAAMAGCSAVIHLAWNAQFDNFRGPYSDPNNYGMAQNVYRAALATKASRVIMASSIHADMPPRAEPGSRTTDMLPEPDSPYGATKVGIESLGRYFARKGLEVVCIRFGWVSDKPDDRPKPDKPYPANEGWMSHTDCRRLITRCLTVPEIPDKYQIIWGLSRRQEGGTHNLDNAIGWSPVDFYHTPSHNRPAIS